VIVLADNDIVLKLAACDLFGEFFTAFATTRSTVQILPTARNVLTSKRVQKRLAEAVRLRLTEFLANAPEINVVPSLERREALAEQPRIDDEALLFAACPLLTGSVLVTGDKRALIALVEAGASDATCAAVCAELTGRVYCFEQVIERILAVVEFDAIRERLVTARECDGSLALWLGSTLDATADRFADGLQSFLNRARSETGALLAK
jgi:hypothetical protein